MVAAAEGAEGRGRGSGAHPIYERRRVERRLARLPLDILKRYEKWKDVTRMSGPTGLRAIKGFHDEALRGEWYYRALT